MSGADFLHLLNAHEDASVGIGPPTRNSDAKAGFLSDSTGTELFSHNPARFAIPLASSLAPSVAFVPPPSELAAPAGG